jgi:hypothetical protein
MDFFAWFAYYIGYNYLYRLPELKFTLKDILPKLKQAKIKRGDEEHFQYIKGDIKSHFERTEALMPES